MLTAALPPSTSTYNDVLCRPLSKRRQGVTATLKLAGARDSITHQASGATGKDWHPAMALSSVPAQLKVLFCQYKRLRGSCERLASVYFRSCVLCYASTPAPISYCACVDRQLPRVLPLDLRKQAGACNCCAFVDPWDSAPKARPGSRAHCTLKGPAPEACIRRASGALQRHHSSRIFRALL